MALLEELQAKRAPADTLDVRDREPGVFRVALEQLPEGCTIEHVIFGAPDYRGQPADLSYLVFPRDTSFVSVSFARMRLANVTFRNCKFVGCDFRYAQVTGANFKNATFINCDFYSATFGPQTVFFGGVTLDGISLSGATLSSMEGLTRATFDRRPAALIQERTREEYQGFLGPTEGDRDAGHPVELALASAPTEAASVYRSLSRMWAGQGESKFARFAYVRSKELERRQLSPSGQYRRSRQAARSGQPFRRRFAAGAADWLTWVWLGFAGALRYGDSFLRVAAAIVGVTLAPAVMYSLVGGVQNASRTGVHKLFTCWLFSIEQVTASPAKHLQSANSVVDLVGSLETVATITLLGLLGTAFASRLRGS